MSADFSHFAFSSQEYIKGIFESEPVPGVVFAPGGRGKYLGSAYDNNVHTHTVEVISKLPNGDDIPLESSTWTPQEEGFQFRGISRTEATSSWKLRPNLLRASWRTSTCGSTTS